jgi:ribonuclease HI
MKNQQTTFELFFDGACLPKNPGGHIGYGFWITQNQEPIIDGSDYDISNPKNSNNVAEYKGLLMGLNALLDHILLNKIENYKVNVFGDSTLVINQCNFRWRIKDGLYAETARKVIPKLRFFEKISFKWIPREENDKADQMSRRALIENGFI